MAAVTSYDIGELGSSIEVDITRNDPPHDVTYSLYASAGSTLVVALGASTAEQDGIRPNITIQIYNPREERVDLLQGGGSVFADPDPMPGNWRFRVRSDEGFAGEFHAAEVRPEVFREPTAYPGWFRCRTCKFLIRALIVALLMHVIHFGLAVHGIAAFLQYLQQHVPSLLQVLYRLIPEGWIERLLDLLGAYTDDPIDRLLERVCALLGMCAG